MKGYIKKYFSLSPFLFFLPAGLFYMVIVWMFHTDTNFGDELRYLTFSNNLLHGFYSPPPPAINLWSAPGYPLVILPFVWLKLPLISISLLNACFQYLSVVFLFFTLKKYVTSRIAIITSCLWVLYYPALWTMASVFSESLTIMVIVLICLSLAKAFHFKESVINKWIIISGCLIGFLILVKIIFGYVLLLLFTGAVLYYFLKKGDQSKKILFCLSIALLTNVPYLSYTYSLTNKMFYWGNSGGENLYWMSTPFSGEYGEWHGSEIFDPKNANTSLVKNHLAELEGIRKLEGVERDDAYKQLSVENIKNHPVKYLRNCLANISRMLFDTPLYFASPTDLFLIRIFPTCMLLPFIIISILVVLFNFLKIPAELKLLFFITFLYFSFAVLVSAYNRHFYIMVPVFLIFIAYVFEKYIKVMRDH